MQRLHPDLILTVSINESVSLPFYYCLMKQHNFNCIHFLLNVYFIIVIRLMPTV